MGDADRCLALRRTLLRRVWVLADTEIGFVGHEGVWRVLTYPDTPSRRWADKHAVLNATFSTRREAVRTVAALLAADPLPVPQREPLRVVRAGVRRSADGRYKATRSAGSWVVTCDGHHIGGMPAASVRQAEIQVAAHRAAQTDSVAT